MQTSFQNLTNLAKVGGGGTVSVKRRELLLGFAT